ncbi:MAG: hypothetical protein CMF75_08065 [Maricaulis sp.]|nr:hypothetical protein [Maricaulis sp.]
MTEHTQAKRPAGVWPVQLILAGLTLWYLYWSAAIWLVTFDWAVLPLPVPDTHVFVSRLPDGMAAAMLLHQSINILAFVLLSLRRRLALWGVILGMAMHIGVWVWLTWEGLFSGLAGYVSLLTEFVLVLLTARLYRTGRLR